MTAYPVYVVSDVDSWASVTTFPERVGGSVESVVSDAFGKLAPTVIYSDAVVGGYDVVLDLNVNVLYDSGDLLVDGVVASAGFFLIPEYLLGELAALGACFAAFAVLKRKSIHK